MLPWRSTLKGSLDLVGGTGITRGNDATVKSVTHMKSPNRSTLTRSMTVSLTILTAILMAIPTRDAGAGAPLRAGESAIEIDRASGEVRIPCRFFSATRVLEVFACHRTGPKHETVVVFDARGPEIHDALKAIGCRSASFWNITGPDGFARTQGDRLLVLVRWRDAGVVREYPAEGILFDFFDETADIGFPAFVRGFSFGAGAGVHSGRDVASSGETDSKREAEPDAESDPGVELESADHSARSRTIPDAVEVTLGGTNRGQPAYSLLWHPTTSPRLLPWMMPPVVNHHLVTDLRQLVEESVPVELILRRLDSEVALVHYLKQVEGRRALQARRPLYEAMEPIARQIDSRKSQLVDVAARLSKLIRPTRDATAAPPVDPGSSAELRGLALRAELLTAQIEAAYLEIYDLQETYRREWVRDQKELPAPFKEHVRVLTEDGFGYEPKLARRRVELAAARVSGAQPEAPEIRGLHLEMQAIEGDRDIAIVRANLAYVRRLAGELEPDDSYLRRVYSQDQSELRAEERVLVGTRRRVQSELDEVRARGASNWSLRSEAILRERARAELEIELGKVERELAKLDEEAGWAEEDLESGNPDFRAEGKKTLEELKKKRAPLEARRAELADRVAAAAASE